MYKVIYILVLYGLTTFAQNTSKLNTTFYNLWIEVNFYNKIIHCETTVNWEISSQNITQLFFFENTSLVQLKTLYEGLIKSYKIKNANTVTLTDLNNKNITINLTSKNKQTMLAFASKDTILYFFSLDKKYYNKNGVTNLINDKFISGDYYSTIDTSLNITFTTDGKVTGIKNFNTYMIPIQGIPLPQKLDIIVLYKIINNRIDNKKILHWKKENNLIYFYNLKFINGEFSEPIVSNEFLILKKTRR